MNEKDPAPALTRGIKVLQLLQQNGPMSLENVARHTGYPKASLLRIFQSLSHLGLVNRSRETREFIHQAKIVPLRQQETLDSILQQSLQNLADETTVSAEWYVKTPGGMVMIRRAEPATGELHVRARLGFRRGFRGELDALAMLGNAFFANNFHWTSDCWYYCEDGVRGPIAEPLWNQQVQLAEKNHYARDMTYNVNGVKRLAHLMLHNGMPLGILCVAMHQTPNAAEEEQNTFQALLQAANMLQHRLDGMP